RAHVLGIEPDLGVADALFGHPHQAGAESFVEAGVGIGRHRQRRQGRGGQWARGGGQRRGPGNARGRGFDGGGGLRGSTRVARDRGRFQRGRRRQGRWRIAFGGQQRKCVFG